MAGEEAPEVPEEVSRTQPLSAATWYDTRIISKAKQLTAQLIDLRRLHAAVEAAPTSGFVAPLLPIRSGFEATPVVDADHGVSESRSRQRRGRCCGLWE